MTPAFFTTLTARLTELTQDLRFDHLPTGVQRAPQVIATMLERPTGGEPESEELPFVRWIVHEGEFARLSPAPFTVYVDGGIFTEGTISDGTIAISALCVALGKIVEKPWFKPYKLRNRVHFEMGDQGNMVDSYTRGLQPHPFYYCRLTLEFVVAHGHGGK